MKGKIGTDETKTLSVSFCCKEEKVIKGDIEIFIRGGKTIKIPFTAKTIIPKLDIMEV